MADANTIATTAAVALGAPIYSRGQLGHVVGIKPTAGNSMMIGLGGAGHIKADLEIVWSDGSLSEIPDAMARRDLDDAARHGFPPALNPEDLRAAAMAKRADARAERQAAEDRSRAEREAFEADARGRIPAGSKAVIVAELVKDDSDYMSDYFNSTTTRTIILAFSSHGRDLFPEMRRAALNHPEVAHLAEAPENAEHREKYSMGGGYYLKKGYQHSSGWRIRKRRFYGDQEPVKGLPTAEWAQTEPKAKHTAPAPAVAVVETAGALRIEAHTHSKRGFAMWIVILPGRVERDEFDRLRAAAETLGGWYSRPWGKTPGGFAFKVQASAESFAASSAGADAPAESPRTTPEMKQKPTPDTGAKLRRLADSMQGEIDGKFAPRLANTPKRQREADTARIEGSRLQRTQRALRALADLHDGGEVPAELRAITSKAAAYGLLGSVIDRGRAGYYDAGIDTDQPANTSAAALALWSLAGSRSAEDHKAETLRRKLDALRFAKIPGYFPTPADVVARMIEAAEIPDGEPVAILEPEAGSGAILDAIREAFPLVRLSAYERQASLREVLDLKGYALDGSDFLDAAPAPTFDFVLMNPPFENGQDIDHVRHAFAFLRPGGRLVAIMSPGPFFRQGRHELEFRDWFDDLAAERVALPSGSFKASGTGVETLMVAIDKPEGE